jgi:DNA-binding MurR/RpiR family transcriptional regulator
VRRARSAVRALRDATQAVRAAAHALQAARRIFTSGAVPAQDRGALYMHLHRLGVAVAAQDGAGRAMTAALRHALGEDATAPAGVVPLQGEVFLTKTEGCP